MLIEVDVESGPNCDWSMTRLFEAEEQSRRVTRVSGVLPDGSTGLCQVTGWCSEGPCPAYAALVADSGEGAAVLVYGGDQGIRLQAADSTEPWDVASPRQWGEPCLLVPRDVLVE